MLTSRRYGNVTAPEVRMASTSGAPACGRGSTCVRVRPGYSAAARAAFTIPAPKKELRLVPP